MTGNLKHGRELEKEWYGDTDARPGKKLREKPLSEHEREIVSLRWRQSREVYVLGEAVAGWQGPLWEAVLALVKVVDHLNCLLADIAVPDTGDEVPDPERPDFSGLTVGALQAKRICLCLGAKKATRHVDVGLLFDAERVVREALDTCFRRKVLDGAGILV